MTTRKSIERGETISAPLKETAVFPPMVTQMIGVGEATGALDTMLAKIADFYEEEVDTAVAGLLTLLEPIMIAHARHRRRRHRHRDVPADLRSDQQADVRGPWLDTDLQAETRLAHRHPGRHQHDPAGIGDLRPDHGARLVSGRPVLLPDRADLRADDRLRADAAASSTGTAGSIDVQLAGDALVVSAFIYFTGGITSYFSSLYVLPIVAGSTVQFRRGGLLVATLSAVLYVGLVLAQYLAARRAAARPVAGGGLHSAAVADHRPVHRRAERVRLLRGRGAQRIARRGRAVGRRAPRAGVDRDRRPAGAQPARHRQPAERPGDDRSARSAS